jgi:uncharacterized membrane protein YbaN (DUF454 family)
MKRVAVIASGWSLLLLGLAGLVLPVLPGVLLLIIGLSVLSVEYAWAHRWLTALRSRFPVLNRKAQEIHAQRLANLAPPKTLE